MLNTADGNNQNLNYMQDDKGIYKSQSRSETAKDALLSAIVDYIFSNKNR